MQKKEFVTRYNHLAEAERLERLPVPRAFVLQQIGRGKRVLDVGCQGGQFSRQIMDRNNEVWGVELNAEAAELARERGIRVKVADVEEGLPFESASFDVVNAGEMLERIYDTKLFLDECNRVLKPDGTLIFTAPNLNSLENRFRVLAGGYLAMSGAYPEDHYGEHIRIFNLAKLRELCGATGFRFVEVRGVPTLKPKGRWIDIPLERASRLWPSLAKVLIVKVRKNAGPGRSGGLRAVPKF